MGEHAASWFSTAASALSGLGTTLHGVSSLYSLADQANHLGDIAGMATSGAVAVSSGLLAAAKLGGPASVGLSMTTVGLGASALYASVGCLYFIRSVMWVDTDVPPTHAPLEGSSEYAEYPSPDWLSTRVLNWGVMGRVGVGKSTLINSLRGIRPKAAEAAPVGIGHTTRRPHPYSFSGDVARLTRNMARLWDLPGADTRDWPASSYIKDVGLRHFDGVIFVTAGALSVTEVDLINQLMGFKVPYFVVRNKVDQDAQNNLEDNDMSVEETLREIRDELIEHGCDPHRTFLVAAKCPDRSELDFGRLMYTMASDAASQRVELPEFCGEGPAEPTPHRFRYPHEFQEEPTEAMGSDRGSIRSWHAPARPPRDSLSSERLLLASPSAERRHSERPSRGSLLPERLSLASPSSERRHSERPPRDGLSSERLSLASPASERRHSERRSPASPSSGGRPSESLPETLSPEGPSPEGRPSETPLRRRLPTETDSEVIEVFNWEN